MSGGPTVAVFGSSRTSPGSSEWSDAEEVGSRLARSGASVVTGGYGGVMEAVSKGASSQGARVTGVVAPALFLDRAGPNPYVTEVVEADDLVSRIGTMIGMADGVIALPGSIGTATELLVSWNHNYIERLRGAGPLPTVAVGDGWKVVVRALRGGAGADPGDIHLADTAGEAVAWLLESIQLS